jgi:hypothetical protein
MKLLLVGLVLSSSVFGVSLGQYVDSLDGASLQRFEINSNSATYTKRSNLFDVKKDLSVGIFELEKDQLRDEKVILTKVLQKIQEVDQYLKTRKSSFNELSQKKPHESFILLNDYRISQHSDLYPELKSVFNKLMAKTWKQREGAQLSDDYKSLSVISRGKVISVRPFNLMFSCKKGDLPTVCRYKDEGLIYLR